jgi:hypothetical protein
MIPRTVCDVVIRWYGDASMGWCVLRVSFVLTLPRKVCQARGRPRIGFIAPAFTGLAGFPYQSGSQFAKSACRMAVLEPIP